MRSDRISVLVVDDERFFREAIVEILVAAGFDCEACEDGEGALKLLAGRTFSVAIVDVRLPGSDGVEVMRQLRAARHEMRVIMLSEPSDQEEVLTALRSGACDYLAKPLHDEELLLSVQRAAGDHDIERDYVRLRHRIDDLAMHFEDFNLDLDAAAGGARNRAVYDAAVGLVSRALDVEKASLMRLESDASRLEVVAATGREIDLMQMDSVALGEGMAGRSLEDLSSVVVGDTRSESHFAADLSPERYRTHSFAIAPIAIGERALGVLCATDRVDGDPLRQEDLAVLRLIASQVADRLLAIEATGDRLAVDAELGEELEEELPESLSGEFDGPLVAEPPQPQPASDDSVTFGETVAFAAPIDLADPGAHEEVLADGKTSEGDSELARRICDAMVHEVEPSALLRDVLHAVESELDADPAGLYLIDSASGELVLEAAGVRELRTDHERLPTNRGLTATVLQRGQLVASSDPTTDARFDASVDAPTDGQPGPLLMLPLQVRGKTIGLARVHLAEGASVSARTGEVLVAALSAAIRNVLLYRSLLESIEEVAMARREGRS